MIWARALLDQQHNKGDPYLSALALASSALGLSSTLMSFINSGNKISPYLNTKYHHTKRRKEKDPKKTNKLPPPQKNPTMTTKTN